MSNNAAREVTGDQPADEPEQELSLVGVSEVTIESISPSPENDDIYRPIDPDDPGIIAFAESIATHGVMEPIVVTLDAERADAIKLAGIRSAVNVMLNDLDLDELEDSQ